MTKPSSRRSVGYHQLIICQLAQERERERQSINEICTLVLARSSQIYVLQGQGNIYLMFVPKGHSFCDTSIAQRRQIYLNVHLNDGVMFCAMLLSKQRSRRLS
jgi:hypothetical protein